MNEKVKSAGIVPADPSQWGEKSQGSVSSSWTTEYVDRPYVCWRCRKAAVFSAEDQKYTYEVKKAPIDQYRILCIDCWRQSLVIARNIEDCETEWASNKVALSKNKEFLSRWLQLLVSREGYVPYRSNTAAKNMLQKFLNALG